MQLIENPTSVCFTGFPFIHCSRRKCGRGFCQKCYTVLYFNGWIFVFPPFAGGPDFFTVLAFVVLGMSGSISRVDKRERDSFTCDGCRSLSSTSSSSLFSSSSSSFSSSSSSSSLSSPPSASSSSLKIERAHTSTPAPAALVLLASIFGSREEETVPTSLLLLVA
jgi:hypothetical protein